MPPRATPRAADDAPCADARAAPMTRRHAELCRRAAAEPPLGRVYEPSADYAADYAASRHADDAAAERRRRCRRRCHDDIESATRRRAPPIMFEKEMRAPPKRAPPRTPPPSAADADAAEFTPPPRTLTPPRCASAPPRYADAPPPIRADDDAAPRQR